MVQKGRSGDGCDLESTLCKYDLRKGYLFVLSWERVRQVMLGTISLGLLMCGESVRVLIARYIENRCRYMVHACFYVGCSDCVGYVGMFVV